MSCPLTLAEYTYPWPCCKTSPPTLTRSPFFGERRLADTMSSRVEPTFTLVVLPLSLMSTGLVFQAKRATAAITMTTAEPMSVEALGSPSAAPRRRGALPPRGRAVGEYPWSARP